MMNKNIHANGQMRTLRDAVYGLAVGDALGLPVQFEDRDSYHIDGMVGHGTFDLPAGSWSDDTSLTLATCDSIRRNDGKINLESIYRQFRQWLFLGKYTPCGYAYDIGGTCMAAISDGKGQTDEWSCGNGSLMQIIPLAFVENITDQEIRDVSAITHANPRCMEGCVYYVRIAQGLLEGRDLCELIEEIVPAGSEYFMLREIECLDRDEIKSSGYIIDTFEAAVWCLLTTSSYRECLLKAVNLGHDTDTVGTVAGGLAGIIYGYDAIPVEWIDALQAKEKIEECVF